MSDVTGEFDVSADWDGDVLDGLNEFRIAVALCRCNHNKKKLINKKE